MIISGVAFTRPASQIYYSPVELRVERLGNECFQHPALQNATTIQNRRCLNTHFKSYISAVRRHTNTQR